MISRNSSIIPEDDSILGVIDLARSNACQYHRNDRRRDHQLYGTVFNVCCKLNYLGIEFKCRGIDEHRHVKNMIRKTDTAIHF